MLNNIDNGEKLEKCYKKADVYTQIKYYQTPKFLIHDAKYKALGLSEKLVYAILRDRLELSLKNNWADEHGYIYLRYDQTKLSDLLCIDRKTVRKYLNNLESYGLIVVINEGQGAPNRIYITDISKELDSSYVYKTPEKDAPSKDKQGFKKDGEKFPKGGWGKIPQRVEEKFPPAYGEKFPTSETTSPSDIESINLSDRQIEECTVINKILCNANYELYPEHTQELIKQTVEDIFYSVDNFSDDVKLPLCIIRERLLTLNMNSVDTALRNFSEKDESDEGIGNPKKYFRKVLWNSITESKIIPI